MPAPIELFTGCLLILAYITGILGCYCKFRSNQWSISAAIALAIPSGQGIFSVIFQTRFLLSSPPVGVLLSLLFLGWCVVTLRQQTHLDKDTKRLWQHCQKYALVCIPILLCLIYSGAQILLLPIKNIDALTYHLPRVWLFIQNNSFFLESFNRYHEAIFPVGSDILFYPFLALKTTAGLGIFSLSSYIAIGAAVYSIARLYTSPKNATLATLIVMSLTEIVLQAPSVKNDIIMAGVAISALLIALKLKPTAPYRQLLLLAILCLFGVSTKTTFLAFLPGLAILTATKLQLWKRASCQHLLSGLWQNRKLTLICVIPLLIASQIWLFAWNTLNYETWSGPEVFTHRHQQHDGIKGTVANITRYGIQTLEIGYLTDQLSARALDSSLPSEVLTLLYYNSLEPYFKEAGATREEFYAQWLTHEDYAWFGPLGAGMLYICLPLALIRKPDTRLALLPALGFCFIIAAKVSWMPWNGRFFTTFFITLTPALAVSLHVIAHKWLYRALLGIALASLCTIKIIDFNRYTIPIAKMISRGLEISPQNIIKYTISDGENIWSRVLNNTMPNPGTPEALLQTVPHSATVALYDNGSHLGHFNFYTARPDIRWVPLNIRRTSSKITPQEAINRFIRSDHNYCLFIGKYPTEISNNFARHSPDNYAHLITKAPPVRLE
jgi:hypothetical protein